MKIHAAGFTLIELLVTVFIIGVLAAVAMPAYQNYVTNGKRKQAEAVMLNLSQMEERYYTNNYAYYPVSSVPPTADPQGWPNFSGTNMSARTYNLVVTVPTATTYTITATPSNGFIDAQCGILTMNSTGAKGQNGGTGNGASPCW
jgi:type IV pilus assembly protein PilE